MDTAGIFFVNFTIGVFIPEIIENLISQFRVILQTHFPGYDINKKSLRKCD